MDMRVGEGAQEGPLIQDEQVRGGWGEAGWGAGGVGGNSDVPGRGDSMCKAGAQRRPGRLTLPSSLPHQRIPALGS